MSFQKHTSLDLYRHTCNNNVVYACTNACTWSPTQTQTGTYLIMTHKWQIMSYTFLTLNKAIFSPITKKKLSFFYHVSTMSVFFHILSFCLVYILTTRIYYDNFFKTINMWTFPQAEWTMSTEFQRHTRHISHLIQTYNLENLQAVLPDIIYHMEPVSGCQIWDKTCHECLRLPDMRCIKNSMITEIY